MTMEKSHLENYYDQYDEDSRLRSPHGMVEFLTTVKYIEKYLTPGARILEIGAGTGRYSHHFAQRGYAVDAVELVRHNIDVFNANTRPGEPVTIRWGNALNLSFIPSDAYDIVLLLGPMYHLYTIDDQKQALKEAIRVCKPGGVIYAAYCGNDATIVQFCFGRGMMTKEPYRSLIDPVTFKASSTPEELFTLYRKEDIDALMADLPVERLHYVGADMAANYIRDTIDHMDEEMFALFLRYHFTICERADMVGVSHHILDVFRKQ
ncbi:MAG: methyltransferase domain-containing protein [Clostridia bacterium]|nr:methyltransferase domain-containing protein [Clostridia bacterium]